MVARVVAALAVIGVLASCFTEDCPAAATCACNCPQARLTEADNGSTVDFPQANRVDVVVPLAATGATPVATLKVSDDNVLLVQPSVAGHALQFVTGRPGRARITVVGTSFVVDVVVHRWPFSSPGDNELNPYNPVTVNATVGQEFGIRFYTSPGEAISVASDDTRTVQVLDAFTAPSLSGAGRFGIFRAVGRGRTKVTVILGAIQTPARPTLTPLFPITVIVA